MIHCKGPVKESVQAAKFHLWTLAGIIEFIQYPDEPCVYKRSSENVVVFFILYVDDILLIGNNVGTLSSVKVWLST